MSRSSLSPSIRNFVRKDVISYDFVIMVIDYSKWDDITFDSDSESEERMKITGVAREAAGADREAAAREARRRKILERRALGANPAASRARTQERERAAAEQAAREAHERAEAQKQAELERAVNRVGNSKLKVIKNENIFAN